MICIKGLPNLLGITREADLYVPNTLPISNLSLVLGMQNQDKSCRGCLKLKFVKHSCEVIKASHVSVESDDILATLRIAKSQGKVFAFFSSSPCCWRFVIRNTRVSLKFFRYNDRVFLGLISFSIEFV